MDSRTNEVILFSLFELILWRSLCLWAIQWCVCVCLFTFDSFVFIDW